MSQGIIFNKNLFLLWIGHLISHAGDAIYLIALPWLLLDLTGSKSVTSLIAMSAYLPSIIFGLIAGSIADYYSRRHVMMYSDFFRAGLVCLIPISLIFNFASPILIGVITFLVSIFATPFYPARDALIPDLVNADQLQSANSIISTSGQIAHLLGPLFAGIIVAMVGITHLFTIDAISFSASLFCVYLIKTENRSRITVTGTQWQLIMQGLKYIRKNSGLLSLLIITSVNNLFIMGLAIIGIPVFVREVLDNSFITLSLLESSMATGMIIGSLIIWRFLKDVKPVNILLCGFIIDGLTYSLIFFVNTKLAALLLLFTHGLGIPMITISRTLIIQSSVHVNYLGRIFSLSNIAVNGTTAISVITIGLFLEVLHVKLVFLIWGVLAASCSLIKVLSDSFNRIQLVES